jgi:hypothetical protein
MKALKKIISILGIVIVAVLIAAAAIYVYYGGLNTIVFSNPNQGGEILVYKEVVGDYMNSNDIATKVYNDLKSIYGIETYSGFGIFYDDPDEVATENCRSEVGCILEAKDINKLSEISKHFNIKIFPYGEYTSTNFPYKGMISIFVGMYKVYSAIDKIKNDKSVLYHEGPIMEIYNMKDNVITYRLCGEMKKEIETIKAPKNVANK